MLIDEFIHKIPKAELNIHIEGSLEPELMFELAKRNKIKLPYTSLEDAYSAYRFKDLKSFLEIYYIAMKVLMTEQDFYDLTWAYLKKAAEQNIKHAEVFFDPQVHIHRGIKFETVIKGIYSAMQDAKTKLNITAYPIMCFMRDLSQEDAEKIFAMALDYKDWIVAVGLDSSEMGNPPEKFKDVFAKAREQGFLTVAIAGEVGPPEYIWQAIDILKVSRIDHGVHCMQDPHLVTRLAATQIPLTVCPVSNIMLGVFPSMNVHPLKKMYEEGLCVTVNSDDPAYFHAYINENFIAANSALKLGKKIIYDMCRNSFEASFLDHDRREKLLNELDKFYKQAVQDK